MNSAAPDYYDRYAPHRARTMSFATSVPGARTVCVFGAGDCADVDLELLTASFERVHLVDIDGAVLERARDRQPASARERIVNHGEVDLSGLLERLDDWGEGLPPDQELGPAAVAAAQRLLRDLGQEFDVTLSSCVLSQLILPFQSAWIMDEESWYKFDAMLTAVHLATLTGATRSGGSGLLAFDVASVSEGKSMGALGRASSEELEAFVEQELEAGRLGLHPDPMTLGAQLAGSASGTLAADVELSAPWIWDIGSAEQLVYGLSFRRP